jgi:hypothetical protein
MNFAERYIFFPFAREGVFRNQFQKKVLGEIPIGFQGPDKRNLGNIFQMIFWDMPFPLR